MAGTVLPQKYTKPRKSVRKRGTSGTGSWPVRKWFRRYFGYKSLKQLALQLGLLGLIGVCVWLLVYATTVEEVSCQTQYGECPVELAEYVQSQVPANMVGLILHAYMTLPEHYEYVLKPAVSIEWKKLEFSFYVQEPVVTLTSETQESQGRYYTASFEGKVLTEVRDKQPPVLYLNSVPYVPGQEVSLLHQRAIRIVYFLSSLGYRFDAQVVESVLNVDLQYEGSRLLIMFPLHSQREPEILVSTLQIILTQATIESELVQIDLRYEKPTMIDLNQVLDDEPETIESTESGQIQTQGE